MYFFVFILVVGLLSPLSLGAQGWREFEKAPSAPDVKLSDPHAKPGAKVVKPQAGGKGRSSHYQLSIDDPRHPNYKKNQPKKNR